MSEQQMDARHPATPTRLAQAQREGEHAKSHELAATIQLMLGIAAVWFLVHTLIARLTDFSIEVWSAHDISAFAVSSDFEQQTMNSLYRIGFPLLPLLGVLFVVAVLSHVIQSGSATVSRKSLLRMENLNPIVGWQRLLSFRNLTRGIIGVPKIAIVLALAFGLLWSHRYELANLQHMAIEAGVKRLIQILFTVLMSAAATMFVIALLDYAVERFSFFRRLRMSDQQLRDENKMQGPVPRIAASRQQLYRDL